MLRAGSTVVAPRGHGERLSPAIHACLEQAGIAPGELTAIVAGLGPGPFTGLRVGLVSAAALGHSLAIPTYGVCSLDGIGWRQPGTVLAATDARRKELYWAIYRDGERIDGPAVSKPADLPLDGIEAVVGDGTHRYDLGRPVRDQPRYPLPEALADLAADRNRAGAPSEPLTPLYLRRPDATLPGQRKTVLT